VKNIISKYFDLTSKQKSKINNLKSIYSKWNEKVNLISRKDFSNFYEKHVLHSLSIAKHFEFKCDTKIMDLGSGGGFPGIPLAIFFPNVKFDLVDSIKKKTDILKEISCELELKNTSVINSRAEDLNGSYDFIVTRAVAKLEKLNKWTFNKISNVHEHKFRNGLICLKGGNLEDELKFFKNRIDILLINKIFDEPFFEEKKIIHLYN